MQVALLNAHQEPGQLGLIELEMLDDVHLIHQVEGQAGQRPTNAGLLELKRIKLPSIDQTQGLAQLHQVNKMNCLFNYLFEQGRLSVYCIYENRELPERQFIRK